MLDTDAIEKNVILYERKYYRELSNKLKKENEKLKMIILIQKIALEK